MVLDVGGADVNGGYRQVFADPRFRYLTVDLAEGAGVDIVLDDPYRLPLEDGSVDIVLSGQMLEHCELFWLTFAEMMRVLKPDGYLFLIAPSAGPIHRYPVDCYRFYPDAYRALAKHNNCHLLEVWLDERGPWRDLVGVFAKQSSPRNPPAITPPVRATATVSLPPGSAEEEATRGSVHYLEIMGKLHETLQPALYLEIGVRRGRSLALAQGPAIGVDPEPDLADVQLPPATRLFTMASDDFFRDIAAQEMTARPDLAFIDGMHLFEYALRDFMHIERLATPGTLVVIDDIYPSHPAQAERNRRTRVWTGDIWKLQKCLTDSRPDLVLLSLDTAPTGLLLVAGLDPGNRVLWDRYNPIVRKYSEEMEVPAAALRRDGVLMPDDPRLANLLSVLRRCRDSGAKRNAVVDALRAVLAGNDAR
ncbi:methyltransferase domain-containing protein [Pseudoxanthomonas yeongjuensis]|uniref:methyltransferase domain-containing protein n=1 Tax=Pseudoxanthomonas yeongjuensis TaxID=377616 RepID=UPI001B88344E|nr:methyltransferase domain-containing protein [Pseudoxanthomonas yeongjuensis]